MVYRDDHDAETRRRRARRQSRDRHADDADIGKLPKVANRRRKNRCRRDLHAYLREYYPASTGAKPFSADHRKVIKRMERTILKGGRQGIGVKQKPWSEYVRKEGERLGHHWRMPRTRGTKMGRHVVYDTNYWKSFVFARLSCAATEPTALVLPGREGARHDFLADHLSSEFGTPVSANGRTVVEWGQVPGRGNDWLDCLVGCCVAASMLGVRLRTGDAERRPRKRRRRVSYL